MKALILAAIVVCIGGMTDSIASLFLPKSSLTNDGLTGHKEFYIKKTIWFLVAAVIFMIAGNSYADCDKGYAKVGAGYKFQETSKLTVNGKDYQVDYHSPYSARFELAVECSNFTYGIAHHSQWLDGWPVNNRKEYSKTEIFIDFKYEFDL